MHLARKGIGERSTEVLGGLVSRIGQRHDDRRSSTMIVAPRQVENGLGVADEQPHYPFAYRRWVRSGQPSLV
jgi:hypothetical protein